MKTKNILLHIFTSRLILIQDYIHNTILTFDIAYYKHFELFYYFLTQYCSTYGLDELGWRSE
ncbi:hypothetical protein Mgra_00007385 [Meloidogyne graminicola]|uniref:Uncharacterized protein n=1 Tax=Meloidogyne graminicola TaxID=189291 RepID=A0A8S9ZIR9_9BILA|nr:hypothetical protein Mgra_00007385 [Meloidogyne graminicola]